jgi:Domain of unkown function (DUF1775)
VPVLLPLAARLLLTLAAAAGLLVIGAAPAGAHVEATVEAGAQAGTGPVTVAFSAEAESPSAGIASIRAQLPTGVPPESLSLAAGPVGWALTPTADGYEIGGPALPPGTAAEFTIAIERLPADATVLTFKTLVRYTDGAEDAWIEEPTADNPEPQSPAPVITVAPAASPSPSAPAPTTTTPQPSSPATPSTTPQAQTTDDDSTPVWPIAVGALAVVAVAGGLVYWRQRPRG